MNPGNNGSSQRPMANVNIQDLDPITCGICGKDVFSQALLLKYLSPLQSPTGKEGQAVIQAGFICVSCGAINQFKRAQKDNPFQVIAGGTGTVKQ